MKMTSIEQVKQFMETGGQYIAPSPELPSKKLHDFRRALVAEELKETFEADNIIDIADGLGDLQVVLDGWFLSVGLHEYKDKIVTEIHNSNMSKFCNSQDEAIESIIHLMSQNPDSDESYYSKPVGDKYVIYRTSDDKIMKAKNYFKPDLKSIINGQKSLLPPQ